MRRARLVAGVAIATVGGLLPLAVDHAYAGTVTVPCAGSSQQSGTALQTAFTQADLTPGDDTIQLTGTCTAAASTSRNS